MLKCFLNGRFRVPFRSEPLLVWWTYIDLRDHLQKHLISQRLQTTFNSISSSFSFHSCSSLRIRFLSSSIILQWSMNYSPVLSFWTFHLCPSWQQESILWILSPGLLLFTGILNQTSSFPCFSLASSEHCPRQQHSCSGEHFCTWLHAKTVFMSLDLSILGYFSTLTMHLSQQGSCRSNARQIVNSTVTLLRLSSCLWRFVILTFASWYWIKP